MATYGLDPNSLIDTGDNLRAATNAIIQALEALNAAVNKYLATNLGRTADAFKQAQAKWQSGVQEMIASLGNAVRALDDIRQNYVTTDQRGAAVFN